MKKILFVAISATLLVAGCQKTEIINSVNPNGTPEMTFTTGISKLTKSAVATGTENLQAQGFVLSAVNAYQDTPSNRYFNDIYDGLENKQFTYEDGAWTYGGDSYFWPGKDRDLVFFAISSAQTEEKEVNGENVKVQKYQVPEIVLTGTENNEGKTYDNVTVTNFAIKGYTVTTPNYTNSEKPISGADDDLMVADVVIKNQESESNGVKGQVDLAFNHTLSKVEFVFSTNPQTAVKYPVVINSIAVNKVVKTADLTIGVNFKETADKADNEYDWGASEDNVSYATATPDNSESYTVTYDLPLTAAEQTYATWLVIPQDLTDKTVTISYTIKDATNATSKDKEFVSVWPLKVDNLVDAWKINQYVKYKVNLSPNLITFNPYLDSDWGSAVSVDPSTGKEATDLTYAEIIVGENHYYHVGDLKEDSQVFELENGAYKLTTATSIQLTDKTITLEDGVVTEIVMSQTPAEGN